jgi:hypothetical protein
MFSNENLLFGSQSFRSAQGNEIDFSYGRRKATHKILVYLLNVQLSLFIWMHKILLGALKLYLFDMKSDGI